MAGKGQSFYRRMKREIKGQLKDLETFGFERTAQEVRFYWNFLYFNEIDYLADDEEIPNWQSLWKPRLMGEISEVVEKYIEKYDIYDREVENEPIDYDDFEDSDSYEKEYEGIPFEESGQAEYLERIASLRGNIFIDLDELYEYIQPFIGYIIAIRKRAKGTYQVWVLN